MGAISLRKRHVEEAIELLEESPALGDDRKALLLGKLIRLRDSLCQAEARCQTCPEECECRRILDEVFRSAGERMT